VGFLEPVLQRLRPGKLSQQLSQVDIISCRLGPRQGISKSRLGLGRQIDLPSDQIQRLFRGTHAAASERACLSRWKSRTATSLGLTPPMRAAWPMVRGLTSSNFSTDSLLSPETEA